MHTWDKEEKTVLQTFYISASKDTTVKRPGGIYTSQLQWWSYISLPFLDPSSCNHLGFRISPSSKVKTTSAVLSGFSLPHSLLLHTSFGRGGLGVRHGFIAQLLCGFVCLPLR